MIRRDLNRVNRLNFLGNVTKYAIVGILFALLFYIFVEFLNTYMKNLMINMELIDSNITNFLTTQSSLTFIVLSLISILSNKDEFVYWEDIITYKLKRPHFTNITALSTYIIVALFAFVTVYIFNGKSYIMFTYFILSIILLTFLMYMLLATYFPNREEIKKSLKERFYGDEKKYEKIDNLYSQTLFLLQNKNVRYIEENISFLFEIIFLEKELTIEDKEYANYKLILALTQISKEEPFIFYKFLEKRIDYCVNDVYFSAEILAITLDSLKYLISNRDNPKARKLILELLKLYYLKKEQLRLKKNRLDKSRTIKIELLIESYKAKGNMLYDLFEVLELCDEVGDLIGYNLVLESILDIALNSKIENNQNLFSNIVDIFKKMDSKKFSRILSTSMLDKILQFCAVTFDYDFFKDIRMADYCFEKNNKRIIIDVRLLAENISKIDTRHSHPNSDLTMYLINREDEELVKLKLIRKENSGKFDIPPEKKYVFINYNNILKFAQGNDIFKV